MNKFENDLMILKEMLEELCNNYNISYANLSFVEDCCNQPVYSTNENKENIIFI